MGEVKWTKEQLDAIYKKGQNILVAAAAGSGKTAVLVERIINKIINEGVDIDKLLVVTFTNAAASEMRERVLNAIYMKLEEDSENVNLKRQITLLAKSNICTIDSFCLDIVKNNFYELENISPNFRIGEESELILLKEEVIENIFEKKYLEKDKNFSKLITTYTSYRDDYPLKELVFKIHRYISSNPFPEKWLNEAIEKFNIKNDLDKDFGSTVWGKELLKEVKETLIDGNKMLNDAKELLKNNEELLVWKDIIEKDINIYDSILKNINNWDNVYDLYMNLESDKWSTKKVDSDILKDLKDNAKSIRDNAKKKINSTLDKILISNSKNSNLDIYEMYKILKNLGDLVLEFSEDFLAKKLEKNVLDFPDIEHFALKILVNIDENGDIKPTSVAKMYKEKFSEIAIDEYQDSNLVQESILTSVSRGNNIFMVGDVKQSIYKFRQAVPELFISKYLNYILSSDLENQKNKSLEENKEEGIKIQLFKNFRSRINVLDFTNIIFQNIMSYELGDIDYVEEEYLNLGASFEDINQDLKTEINILDLENIDDEEDEEENKSKNKENEYIEKLGSQDDEQSEENQEEDLLENIEIEAKFIANRIKKLIDEKFQVFDRKLDRFRDITYKDIAVLFKTTKDAANICEREILKLGIPVFSDKSEEYLETIEIKTIIALLKVIDNPINDIALVTVLRSNIFKFTDNDLIQIRLADKYDNFYNALFKAKLNENKILKEKIDTFLEKIENLKKSQEYLSLDEFILKIYLDTRIL